MTSGSTGKPCFNIWGKDGTYYQLGCTSDSLQFYNNNGTQTFSRWEVNKIVAPNDNNGSYKLMLVSYFQDCVPSASPCASTSSVRDDGIAQITYGTGTSTSSISTLDGTIDFAYHAPAVPSSQTKWATAYGNNYHCTNPPTTTTLRCDDPLTDGSITAPSVMSTLTLDSVTSYVGSDSSSSHSAYKYSFSYTDSPFTACWDPYSQVQEYCAGEHLLSSITPSVSQNGTSHQLPGMSFGYSQAENYYWDTENTNQTGGQYNAQNYWQYLTSYMNNDTGVGETISYGTAYNNAHGTPWAYVNGSLDDRHDPLYCWNHRSDVTSEQCTTQSGGYNYSHPEDHAWSVQVVTSITSTGKDSSASSVKLATTSYQYQLAVTGTYSSGSGLQPGYHNVTQEVVSSSNAPTLTRKWSYTTNDSGYGGTGYIYYTVDTATHSEVDDSAGKVWQCQDITYDQGAPSGVSTPDAGWSTTVKSYSDCSNQSNTTISSYQGYDAYGNSVASVDGVAAANSSLYSANGCTLSSAPSIFPASSWSQSHYTSCTTYDSYLAQPATLSNALSQSSSLSYDYTQGALLTSSTDANSQTTSSAYSYDSNSASNGKRIVQIKGPLESASYTSQSYSFSSCSTSSSLPCFEIESNASLYPNAISQSFYDALGRKVETRTPGPVSGDDTVVFTLYNDSNDSTFTSVPFEVADGSGYIDPASAVYVGTSQAPGGTTTFADALGRTLATQDPNFGSSQEPGHACSSLLSGNYTACTNYTLDVSHVSGDSNTYETVTSVDPNDHVSISSIDALGRRRYIQTDSGVHSNTSTLMGNERETYQYNVLDEPTSVTDSDLVPQSNETITSITTTASYDSLGRMTQLVDPERGTHTYTYDADGHMIADVSGSRTLGYSYDLLGRVGCIQDQSPSESATGACTSGANPFVQNTYDTNMLGTQGSNDFPIGRLTQSKATNYFPGPDYTQGYVTQQMQYDQRGRLTNETLQISASGGSLTFPTFPTYQLALSYNDADLPTTTTTSSNPSGLGYSFTNFYDSTTGVLTGLGTSTSAANLATLSYTLNGLPNTFNFQTSTGTALAQEQFSYDTNLRISGATASWQSGSGTSGTIYSQTLSYDAASNITSSTTTQAVVSGATNSGGSEAEIYCYDEQNRLVWAGNSGTPQGASNGTCGSGTPSNSLSNATYSNQYVYTHLGQLWQGPYNGNNSYQYLYCNTSQPHQLTGLYPTGTTCSTTSGKTQSYAASYDSWGNMTTRTASGAGGTTATLAYDGQDHLMRWNDTKTTTNEEWYLYDASGQRVLRRSQTGTGNSNTKYTITVFGLEDHIYDGGGTNLNNKYYYSLAGQLIGVNTGSTNYLFTDALGSVVSSISNTANSALIKGNQVYGPYGNNPYSKGTMGTTKGYTGQYNDSLTQLDYYGARYYDPFVGIFLSADRVQGNLQGQDPYAYVGANPETHNDPTGQCPWCIVGALVGAVVGAAISYGSQVYNNYQNGVTNPWTDNIDWGQVGEYAIGGALIGATLGAAAPAVIAGIGAGAAAWSAGVGLSGVAALSYAAFTVGPEAENSVIAASSEESTAVSTDESTVAKTAETNVGCGGQSFSSNTLVATPNGKQQIGKLRTGDKVLAYDPVTKKESVQTVQHVYINHDKDLVDITLRLVSQSSSGRGNKRLKTEEMPPSQTQEETIHTTASHPWLTKDHSWVRAGKLYVGELVVREGGETSLIVGLHIISGQAFMYDLTVSHIHTFMVGHGDYVVHNDDCPDSSSGGGRRWFNPNPRPAATGATSDPNAPAPQSVLDLAGDTGTAQNQFIGGKATRFPDVGGLAITDQEGNLIYRPQNLYWGEGSPAMHAESIAVGDATNWLGDNAEPGQSYAVHVVTEYEPCQQYANSCMSNIQSGNWDDQLNAAAAARGANAGLFVWWHRNSGLVQLVP